VQGQEKEQEQAGQEQAGQELVQLEQQLEWRCLLLAMKQMRSWGVEDVDDDPVRKARLKEHIRKHDLPPHYWEHPVVAASKGGCCVPYALYMDAKPYSHTDGVWVSGCLI
jgi:hypothetical protein